MLKKKIPDVSIIVPVFNSEKYLEKCIDSLLNQTLINIEIIIINDGSTDNSLKIAEQIAKKDRRIKIFSKSNGGLSSARNFGISNANGMYLGFVDSDDYVSKDMFKVMFDMCQKNNCDISICGWYLVKDNKINVSHFKCNKTILTAVQATDVLLNHFGFDSFSCNKLFRKELFNDIVFPEGKFLEDVLTTYKLISISNKIVINSVPLYYYVQHENSITYKQYLNLDENAFNSFTIRYNDLLKMYPNLSSKIKSNYFTSNKLYFIISLKSKNRNKQFEKERISFMRKNIIFVWKDYSIPLRVKISSTLISVFPYLYFKVRK